MRLKYKMPGTFLIVTDRVEADDAERAMKNCSWAELKEMAAKGMEVASTRLKPVKDQPGTFTLVLADKPSGACEPGDIWLRLAPGEKVAVNGKPETPNAHHAVRAHTGDTIAVEQR